jgi:(2Fe-2S) ferredoxin
MTQRICPSRSRQIDREDIDEIIGQHLMQEKIFARLQV